ncbi:hypothetical protein Tco_0252161 [Tanacetum coccineum]
MTKPGTEWKSCKGQSQSKAKDQKSQSQSQLNKLTVKTGAVIEEYYTSPSSGERMCQRVASMRRDIITVGGGVVVSDEYGDEGVDQLHGWFSSSCWNWAQPTRLEYEAMYRWARDSGTVASDMRCAPSSRKEHN